MTTPKQLLLTHGHNLQTLLPIGKLFGNVKLMLLEMHILLEV